MSLIHAATFDDLDARTAYLLWQLRERVFVVEQECPYLDLDGRDLDPGTVHLWVEEDGRPVAYLRLLAAAEAAVGTNGSPGPAREGAGVRVGRVVVAPERRGHGLADRLMRDALARVGDRPCRLDAQSYLVDFYRGLGFEQVGEEFLDDGIPHVPMLRRA